jgi:hypothetical protein
VDLVTHRTVERYIRREPFGAVLDPADTVDLSGCPLLRLHGHPGSLSETDLRRARIQARVTSDTGWTVTVGQVTSAESFLAISGPDGAVIVFGLRLMSASRGPVQVALAMRPALPELFGLIPGSVLHEMAVSREEYEHRAWQRVVRIHEITPTLPKQVEPKPFEDTSRQWVEHAIGLGWALFATAETAKPWQSDASARAESAWAYASAGHTPAWSAQWLREITPVETAEFLDRHGWNALEAESLGAICDPEDRDEEDAHREQDEWIRSGVRPRLAVLAAAAGLTPAEALSQIVTEASLTILAVLRGTDPEDLADLPMNTPTEVHA